MALTTIPLRHNNSQSKTNKILNFFLKALYLKTTQIIKPKKTRCNLKDNYKYSTQSRI